MKQRKPRKTPHEIAHRKLLPSQIRQQMDTAIQHHMRGEIQQAMAIYTRVLEDAPDHADALHLSGVAFHNLGHHEQAVEMILQAIRISPKSPMFYYNLGAAYHALSCYNEAVQSYQKALVLNPDYAEVYSNLGNTYHSLGKTEESISALQKAVRLKQDFADAYNNLGAVFNSVGRYDDALACYQKALAADPDCYQSYHNIGDIYREQDRLSEALSCYQKALSICPGHPEVSNNLGIILQMQGDIAGAVRCYEAALQGKPDYAAAHSNMLMALHYDYSGDWDGLFQKHRQWDVQHGAGRQAANQKNTRHPADRIHVGYLSPDFRLHSVAYYIEPVLKSHDPGRFRITCYSDVSCPDEVTLRFKSLGWDWRDVSAFTDDRLFDQIQTDKVDLLVDLAGHTAHNRLPLFARKPAPVQITWIGYPDTTGLAAMDYRITDPVADPPGVSDQRHAEKLIRLPGSFLCYQPSEDAPEVSDLPGLRSGSITYGSFNNRSKITETVVRTWAAILQEVPSSRLILKAKAMDDPEICRRLADRFMACGVDPQRVELHGFLPQKEHFALYHRVDMALDTFPYNGTTTTCEALWMGVPVMVMQGDHHVSRVGASLLTHIGLDPFIAGSRDDYIQRTAALSRDLTLLSALRSRLREIMLSSPLMDAAFLTRSLEQAYENVWMNWQQDHAEPEC